MSKRVPYVKQVLQILAKFPKRGWQPYEIGNAMRPKCGDATVGYYCRVLVELGVITRVGRGTSRHPYHYTHNPKWNEQATINQMREFLNDWRPNQHADHLDSVVEEFLEDYERVRLTNEKPENSESR